jgi:hypothetical protein
VVAAAWLTVAILAQAPSPWSAAATLEQTRESLRYRFDNPSTFDTPALVPHFFEQTYDTRNIWLGARVTHPLFGRTAVARASLTPQATRAADDFDTFFQPDGNVIVSGTTGNASIRSWRLEERVALRPAGPVSLGFAFAYRHDRARFHEGTGIVRMTTPPSETRRAVTTREFVTSRMAQGTVFATATRGAFSITSDVVPIAAARLTIDLPDKYPGRLLRFGSRYSAAALELRYARRIGQVRMGAGIRSHATWPWRNTAAVHLRSVGVFIEAGN